MLHELIDDICFKWRGKLLLYNNQCNSKTLKEIDRRLKVLDEILSLVEEAREEEGYINFINIDAGNILDVILKENLLEG